MATIRGGFKQCLSYAELSNQILNLEKTLLNIMTIQWGLNEKVTLLVFFYFNV